MNYFDEFANGKLVSSVFTDHLQVFRKLEKVICIIQSIPAVSTPLGNCVATGDQALAYPRATPRLLTHTWFLTLNSNMEVFSRKEQYFLTDGLSVKDWAKLWRFLKVCSLNFIHFLITYQATTSVITIFALSEV